MHAYLLLPIYYCLLPIYDCLFFPFPPSLDKFLSPGRLYCWYTKNHVYAYGEELIQMNRYSLRLAWVGTLIGVLTLSAVAIANLSRAEARAARRNPGPAAPSQTAALETAAELWEEPAAQVFAPGDGDCSCLLCFSGTDAAGAYELLDLQGRSFGTIRPDSNLESLLGPLPPGRYQLTGDGTSLGSFRITEEEGIEETGGRLWTDGERLWLETFCPGAAEIRLQLPHPGYFSYQLVDDLGRQWTRDVFLSDRTPPDPDGLYRRVLRYDGLPEGRYTLVEAGQPLTQFRVLAGGTALISVDN